MKVTVNHGLQDFDSEIRSLIYKVNNQRSLNFFNIPVNLDKRDVQIISYEKNPEEVIKKGCIKNNNINQINASFVYNNWFVPLKNENFYNIVCDNFDLSYKVVQNDNNRWTVYIDILNVELKKPELCFDNDFLAIENVKLSLNVLIKDIYLKNLINTIFNLSNKTFQNINFVFLLNNSGLYFNIYFNNIKKTNINEVVEKIILLCNTFYKSFNNSGVLTYSYGSIFVQPKVLFFLYYLSNNQGNLSIYNNKNYKKVKDLIYTNFWVGPFFDIIDSDNVSYYSYVFTYPLFDFGHWVIWAPDFQSVKLMHQILSDKFNNHKFCSLMVNVFGTEVIPFSNPDVSFFPYYRYYEFFHGFEKCVNKLYELC